MAKLRAFLKVSQFKKSCKPGTHFWCLQCLRRSVYIGC